MPTQKLIATSFFATVLAIFLFLAAGYVDCVDAVPSMQAARALWERQSLNVEAIEMPGTFFGRGPDGASHSLMGLLMPLLYLPPLALAKLGAHWIPESVGFPFFVSMVNPILSAVLASLIFLFFLSLNWGRRDSALAAGAFVFGTLLLPYSKTCHRETAQALLLFIAYVSLLPSSRLLHSFLISSSAIVMGTFIKEAFLISSIPILALAWHMGAKKQRLTFFGALCFGGLLHAIVQWRLWGSPFSNGFDPSVSLFSGHAWSTPWWVGFSQQWLHWETGFFFYNPLLLLTFPLLWLKRRSLDRFDIAVMATLILQSLFYSRWYTPIGKEALGPRFLVIDIPLFCLFLRNVPSIKIGMAAKSALACFVAGCVTLQLVHTSIKPQQYWTLKHRSTHPLTTPHWIANLIFFSRKSAGNNEAYDVRHFGAPTSLVVHLDDARTLVGFNFWWSHLLRTQRPASQASFGAAHSISQAAVGGSGQSVRNRLP